MWPQHNALVRVASIVRGCPETLPAVPYPKVVSNQPSEGKKSYQKPPLGGEVVSRVVWGVRMI
jgi:hypothetical protein